MCACGILKEEEEKKKLTDIKTHQVRMPALSSCVEKVSVNRAGGPFNAYCLAATSGDFNNYEGSKGGSQVMQYNER